ncbi:Prolipoprotein diacylglyceryl transferase [compost metagenome]
MRAGELFLSYFIWYSIGRFFIEALRTDSLAFQGAEWVANFVNALWAPMSWMGFEQGNLDASYGNVRISQLLAIVIIVIAVVMIIVRRKTIPNLARYSDPIVSTKSAAIDPLSAMSSTPQQPVVKTKEHSAGEQDATNKQE